MLKTPESILQHSDVKPTSNRILVMKILMEAKSPMSLIEIEEELQTLERSSISRVLSLLAKNGVIHIMEDGRGVSKYEVCHGEDHCSIKDMHVHFYCEKCDRVFCFDEISAPSVKLPRGFTLKSVNYMLKGVCPECSGKDDSVSR